MKTSELIARVEKDFDCIDGFRGAFCDHDGKLTPYVAYAAAAQDEDTLTGWLLDNVFDPLKAAGAEKLYWRYEQKIEHSAVIPLSEDEAKEWGSPFRPNCFSRIYTRIVALDADGNPISIADEIKPEGVPCKELENEK